MPKNLKTVDEKNQKKIDKIIAKGRTKAEKKKQERPTKTVDSVKTKKKKKEKVKNGILKKTATGILTLALVIGIAFTAHSLIKDCRGKTPEPPPSPPGGQEQPLPPGGEDETIKDPLSEDQKTAIGKVLYSGSRSDIPYDVTSIDVLTAEVVENGDNDYLRALISVLEEGKKVLYAVGYKNITTVEEIPTAEIRNKFLSAKDIVKYTHVNEYIKDATEQQQAKEYFKGQTALTDIEDVYVRVGTKSNEQGFKATMDYIAFGQGLYVENSVSQEGRKYDVNSDAELVSKMIGIEKTAEQEMTK